MAASSAALHEPAEKLAATTIDMHRAIVSLMEELEAIDWYAQRVEATDDEELRAILDHNRREEKEHAAMTLEWIRRRDPEFDRILREHLFVEGSITDGHSEGAAAESAPAEGLGIGSLRGGERK